MLRLKLASIKTFNFIYKKWIALLSMLFGKVYVIYYDTDLYHHYNIKYFYATTVCYKRTKSPHLIPVLLYDVYGCNPKVSITTKDTKEYKDLINYRQIKYFLSLKSFVKRANTTYNLLQERERIANAPPPPKPKYIKR